MTWRDGALLSIGFGIGLISIGSVIFIWLHHMFIFGVTNRGALFVLATPLLFIGWGMIVLFRRRGLR